MPRLFLSCVLAFLIASTLAGYSQGLLREGEVFTFKFELSHTGIGYSSFGEVGAVAGWYVPFSEIGPEDILRLDMFEDSGLTHLICSKTVTQPIQSLPLECQALGAWQDLEGAVQLTLEKGSIDNAGWLQVGATLPSEYLGFASHTMTAAVPEPETVQLFCLGAVMGLFWMGRRMLFASLHRR